jgi:2-polyprenyl-3-methyl-5-hydroxy-6-metoxy-1,4-benzoquinol methylase
MITDDKQITTPEYWDKVYSGKNENATVDASNTTRPPNPFDRFGWVAKHADGPNVLDVGSGHAHICKRIKAANPEWAVYASDQAEAAKKVANYKPYFIVSAYELHRIWDDKVFSTIICTQAMEYIDDQVRFIKEAQRMSEKLLITVPIGEMAKWSQLRVYTEDSVQELLLPFGGIEVFERHEDLLLVKLKFA